MVSVTYSVDIASLDVVRSKPQHLLEVLESLLHVVLVVKTETADVHSISTHVVHTQNVTANKHHVILAHLALRVNVKVKVENT